MKKLNIKHWFIFNYFVRKIVNVRLQNFTKNLKILNFKKVLFYNVNLALIVSFFFSIVYFTSVKILIIDNINFNTYDLNFALKLFKKCSLI